MQRNQASGTLYSRRAESWVMQGYNIIKDVQHKAIDSVMVLIPALFCRTSTADREIQLRSESICYRFSHEIFEL